MKMNEESLNTIIMQPIRESHRNNYGATTIDNPAGQNLDIFLITLNNDIPIPILGMVKDRSANIYTRKKRYLQFNSIPKQQLYRNHQTNNYSYTIIQLMYLF